MGQMQADRTSVDGHVGQRGKVGSKRPVSTLNANNRFCHVTRGESNPHMHKKILDLPSV